MTELRDSTEFKKWQEEAKTKDKLEQQEHFQMKKIEMELARDAAIEAT